MINRDRTNYIVVNATMDETDPTLGELAWRDRRYGYLDVRHHYLIRRNGEVVKARDERTVGMACRPHNATSVSVLLAGSPAFTEEQMTSLEGVVGKLACFYPSASVVAHSDLPGVHSEGAPGFDVKAWDVGRRAVLGI